MLYLLLEPSIDHPFASLRPPLPFHPLSLSLSLCGIVVWAAASSWKRKRPSRAGREKSGERTTTRPFDILCSADLDRKVFSHVGAVALQASADHLNMG